MDRLASRLRLPLIVGALLLPAFAWTGCAGSLEDPQEFAMQADAGPSAIPAAGAEAGPAPSCPDVPTLFAKTCGTSGCHDATTKAEALDLASPGLPSRLVGVPSVEGVGLLIDPATPAKSVVYTKLLSSPPFGARMPTGSSLDPGTTQCVLAWVTAQAASSPRAGTDAGAASGNDAAPTADAAADTGAVAPFATIRVAAGQTSAVTDGQGQSWGADTGFTGGTPAVESTQVSIANTDSPALYNGQRYGNPSFSYVFTVPNGTYTVTLKFAELYVTGSGQRLFDIVIDGTKVETAFDIYAAAGAMNTAVDRSYPVTVTGGQIQIDFDQGTIQFPKVDAIEIVAGSSDGGP